MRSLRFFRPRNRWSFHHICYIYSKSARSFPFRPLCFQRFLRTTKMSDFCTHIPSFRYAYGRISIEKVQTSRGHRKFFCQHASCFHTVRSGRMFTVFSVRHRASSPFSRVAIVLRHNALIDSGLLTRVRNHLIPLSSPLHSTSRCCSRLHFLRGCALRRQGNSPR